MWTEEQRIAGCGPPESVRGPGPQPVEPLNIVRRGGARAAWTRERLSSWSSVLPFGFCPDDRVENGEELTETGDDGDFFWSAALNEALIGGFDEGIVPDGDERGHVQEVAGAASPAANHAMAAPCARISVEWSDADERGQLAAIERT